MTETFDQFENALRSTVAVLADRKDSLVVFKGQFDSPFQGWIEMDGLGVISSEAYDGNP